MRREKFYFPGAGGIQKYLRGKFQREAKENRKKLHFESCQQGTAYK